MRNIFLLALLGLAISGCSNVSEWDRQYLAKSYMTSDPNPLLNGFKDHAYFSREGTSGGEGVGGGGCGCN